MLGFDPITLPAMYMLSALAKCPAQGPVEVDVRLAKTDNAYILDQTSAQLTRNFGKNMDTTLATDGKWMVSGVTVVGGNNLRSQFGAEFKTSTNYSSDTMCFTISKITYEIQYSPDVYIASDYKNMGCRYSATLAHEKRHVAADERTFTDYIPYFKDQLERAAEAMPPKGPIPVSQSQDAQHAALKELAEGAAPLWDELLALRRKRQALIDTPENYMRDTALCPGQFPKFDGTP